jgi:hypothetical protein
MVEHGVIFKAYRTGVFVENTPPMPKLLGSNIIGVCHPDEAVILFRLRFYKDTAPTALLIPKYC